MSRRRLEAGSSPAVSGAPGEVQVRLLKPHTHRRVDLDVGAELWVPEATATWLCARAVAEPVKPVIPTTEE